MPLTRILTRSPYAARHDAFDSIVALACARAIAYDANADESRYLLDLASYDSRPAATWQAYGTGHRDLRFTGEFRRELDNITFVGERAAAGKEREAVEFCMGWQPGTSNAHFGAWTAALDKVAGINRAHFTSSVDAGRSSVNGLLPWAVGLLVSAVLLTLFGLRLRFAEFR
ncbi:hypothetical protein ABZ848_47370 [Streptomyces sp. NPDC047081]|uniref:hypothetical protein n=1 Tax=Streptomyces sp. NPDC047081 TaxID=3154706 RepID=UPI0033C3EF03